MHDNYRCVAPGKSKQFLERQYMKVTDENCPLQARPSTLTGITIITIWWKCLPNTILTTAR